MHKFILILLYFDEKIKCISAMRIIFYVQTCDPPRFFLGKFDQLDKVQLNLCFSALTPYILSHYSNSPIYFIEILILYFLPLTMCFLPRAAFSDYCLNVCN